LLRRPTADKRAIKNSLKLALATPFISIRYMKPANKVINDERKL